MGANLLKGSFPKTPWEGKNQFLFKHLFSSSMVDLERRSLLLFSHSRYPSDKLTPFQSRRGTFFNFHRVKANARKKATTILRGKISFPVKTEHFILRTPVIFLGNNCKSTVISASVKELKNHQRELGKHVSYVRLALVWRKTGHWVAGACKIDFETFALRLAHCAALGRSTRAKNLRCAKSSDFVLFATFALVSRNYIWNCRKPLQ